MNCARTFELLSARLDGELEAADEAALDRHLAECAACRRDDADLHRLSTAFAESRRVRAPASLADRVLVRRAPGRARAGLAAAAGFLLFLLATRGLPSREPPARSDVARRVHAGLGLADPEGRILDHLRARAADTLPRTEVPR
ncbi:MAG: anti-sigma factor family protein [Planctomycetota bacterium JB042]